MGGREEDGAKLLSEVYSKRRRGSRHREFPTTCKEKLDIEKGWVEEVHREAVEPSTLGDIPSATGQSPRQSDLTLKLPSFERKIGLNEL